jgi:hypothetical protein
MDEIAFETEKIDLNSQAAFKSGSKISFTYQFNYIRY